MGFDVFHPRNCGRAGSFYCPNHLLQFGISERTMFTIQPHIVEIEAAEDFDIPNRWECHLISQSFSTLLDRLKDTILTHYHFSHWFPPVRVCIPIIKITAPSGHVTLQRNRGTVAKTL